mmetsp:Transcript_20687/g.27924  ORF Transcript_20687/g.27924 Transcript_20687/m.27924 type:complete len:125 (+) Transcript_20687:856-1230(+)
MRTVIPSYIEIDSGMIGPRYDTIDFFPLAWLLLAQLSTSKSTLYIMPEFTPNPIMLEKHADKGQLPWEIFAWCVRDAICKRSGLPTQNNNNFKDKYAYMDFMNCHKDFMEVQGRIFMIGGTYEA